MAGNCIFTSCRQIVGIELVTYAILAGCNNPVDVSAYCNKIDPYIDTDITLESVTDKVRELTGMALIADVNGERQIAIDTLKGELGEWKA